MNEREGIPILDFADHRAGDSAQARFVDALGAGLSRWGFVALTNHGVSQTLVDAAYAQATAVFALPTETKRAYERPECARQRGYTPFGLEKARGRPAPDLKEFWHVGRDLTEAHAFRRRGLMAPNTLPAEVPEFGAVMRQLYAALDHLAFGLLDAIARYLQIEPALLQALAKDGNSVLRIINYPDLDAPAPAGAIRAAAHEDVNLLTILPVATRPGLQILTPDGHWMQVEAPRGAMICDTGDMMALLTQGRMPATTHRVVNPAGASDGGRLSIPFFMHPHPDAMLAPLDGSAPGCTAHEFLMARLRENDVG
ncbi:MAG: isopenicillin N synthase-like dioxygenase [Bradymonadia bacterium]|jgi:isopenicillin N synthase-like dioxygenase